MEWKREEEANEGRPVSAPEHSLISRDERSGPEEVVKNVSLLLKPGRPSCMRSSPGIPKLTQCTACRASPDDW